MKNELQEYALAIEENLEASRAELDIKQRKQKAHYRLITAKEALRAKEQELLEDSERQK